MNIRPCILAGGQGTRLWPASRPEHPKQFLPLAGTRSLIRETYQRVLPLGDGQCPVVVSIEAHEALVQRELAELPADRIWLEPEGRNTGPSVAWALHELQRDDASAVAAFFPADHHVGQPEALRAAVHRGAAVAARTGGIALLGARPDRVEAGYGHIEYGEPVADGVHRVRRFLEKPDPETAGQLSRRDDILWNCGIFIVPVAAGLDLVRAASPALAAFLDALPAPGLARRPGTPERAGLRRAFESVESVPFDVAVLEPAEGCLVVPVEAGWSDLGSWQAVWEVGSRDARGNRVSPGSVVVDADGCLVQATGTRVAALGVKDLVIVAWGDAVLVCPRNRVQEVRQVVGPLGTSPANGGGRK